MPSHNARPFGLLANTLANCASQKSHLAVRTLGAATAGSGLVSPKIIASCVALSYSGHEGPGEPVPAIVAQNSTTCVESSTSSGFEASCAYGRYHLYLRRWR